MSLDRDIEQNSNGLTATTKQRRDTTTFYISPVDSEDSGIADKDFDVFYDEALTSIDSLFNESLQQQQQQQQQDSDDDWSPFGDGKNYPWIRCVDRHGNYRLAWMRIDDVLRGYKPEDILVELDQSRRRVRVSANQNRIAQNDWASRAFQRDYNLPQNLSVGSSLELRSSYIDRDASLIVVVSVVSSPSCQCHRYYCNRRRHSIATTSTTDSMWLDFRDNYGLAVHLEDAIPVACQIIPIAGLSCSS